MQGNGIAKIRATEIINAEVSRVADMDGRAMDRGKSRTDLDRFDDVGRRHGAHADHHIARKGASCRAGDISAIHRDVDSLSDVTNGDARTDECLFKRK